MEIYTLDIWESRQRVSVMKLFISKERKKQICEVNITYPNTEHTIGFVALPVKIFPIKSPISHRQDAPIFDRLESGEQERLADI